MVLRESKMLHLPMVTGHGAIRESPTLPLWFSKLTLCSLISTTGLDFNTVTLVFSGRTYLSSISSWATLCSSGGTGTSTFYVFSNESGRKA